MDQPKKEQYDDQQSRYIECLEARRDMLMMVLKVVVSKKPNRRLSKPIDLHKPK